MNEQDQSLFVANTKWFNQFFGGIQQLYEIVVETLPTGFFPENFTLKSTNFYFPTQRWAPTIPPYYALMAGGKQFALQILAVFDPDLFGKSDLFAAEPSFVVVLHSQPARYGFIREHARRVIGNQGIEIDQRTDGKVLGKIYANPTADFFSFQVPLEAFSADRNPHDAVREHIVDPIIGNLEKIRALSRK